MSGDGGANHRLATIQRGSTVGRGGTPEDARDTSGRPPTDTVGVELERQLETARASEKQAAATTQSEVEALQSEVDATRVALATAAAERAMAVQEAQLADDRAKGAEQRAIELAKRLETQETKDGSEVAALQSRLNAARERAKETEEHAEARFAELAEVIARLEAQQTDTQPAPVALPCSRCASLPQLEQDLAQALGQNLLLEQELSQTRLLLTQSPSHGDTDHCHVHETTERVQGRVGVGLILDDNDGDYVVRSVVDETAAAQCNKIQQGDSLVAVDGRPIRGMSLAEVKQLIMGEINTSVSLALRRHNWGGFDDNVITVSLSRGAEIKRVTRKSEHLIGPGSPDAVGHQHHSGTLDSLVMSPTLPLPLDDRPHSLISAYIHPDLTSSQLTTAGVGYVGLAF